MPGKVSDLPIRYKRAVFTQKTLDRINFRSGNGGRVLRNPPGVTIVECRSGMSSAWCLERRQSMQTEGTVHQPCRLTFHSAVWRRSPCGKAGGDA